MYLFENLLFQSVPYFYNIAFISYRLTGYPKIWYVVPPAYYGRTLRAIHAEFRGSDKFIDGCAHATMHKVRNSILNYFIL